MSSFFFACGSTYLHKGGRGNCQALTECGFDFNLSIVRFITSAHLQCTSSAFFPNPLLIYKTDLSRNHVCIILFGGPSWSWWHFAHHILNPFCDDWLLHTFLESKKAQQRLQQDMSNWGKKQNKSLRICSRTAFWRCLQFLVGKEASSMWKAI